MPASTPERIVIVGGGLEGWTAAAGISHSLQGTGVAISVIDIPGLINVEPAQYTLPESLEFLQHIGIGEDDVLKEAGATFRLGTELHNLRSEGDETLRAFGPYGANIGFVLFHHFATRQHRAGVPIDFNAYSPNAVAAREKKFIRNPEENDKRLPPLTYGLHLNTDKFIKLLRGRAEQSGVDVILGQPRDILQAPDTGTIEAVVLTDDRRVDGNMFVDCSGEAAIVIGESLGVPFVDWSHWLPCDRRVNVTTKGKSDMRPLLHCTATDSGWILQAPLQYRTANQLLYSSACSSDEQASNELISFLGDASADALAIGETRSGHRRQCWMKNCVAFGSAAGRVEPLDVSDFHLIQSSVSRLMRLFPSQNFEPPLAAEYNRQTQDEYECLRDFTLLNYLASDWRDTRFWRRSRGAESVGSLRRRLGLFLSRGRLSLGEHETHSRDAWIAAFITAGFWPADNDPLLDCMDNAQLEAHFDAMRTAITGAVSVMPTHADYVADLLA